MKVSTQGGERGCDYQSMKRGERLTVNLEGWKRVCDTQSKRRGDRL